MDVVWADVAVERQLMSLAATEETFGAPIAALLSLHLQHLRVVDSLADLALLACPCAPAKRPPGHVVIVLDEQHELLLLPAAGGDGWADAESVTVIGVRGSMVPA